MIRSNSKARNWRYKLVEKRVAGKWQNKLYKALSTTKYINCLLLAAWLGFVILNCTSSSIYLTDDGNKEYGIRRDRIVKRPDNNDRSVALDDIFITVKTSDKYHMTRLPLILRTWFTLARNQTYFFTDQEDELFQSLTNNHMVNTNCSSTHHRQDLSCKMGYEFDAYIASGKKWWCHFDDDNYVNVKQLVKLLQEHDWRNNTYLGKASVLEPFVSMYKGSSLKFWFATGGAGFCISYPLAQLMRPWCSNGKFLEISNEMQTTDDCTLGFIITNKLKVNLSQCSLFHSHLEPLQLIQDKDLGEQISFSYSISHKRRNTVLLDKYFNETYDPTRFFSIHCKLYPQAEICSKLR